MSHSYDAVQPRVIFTPYLLLPSVQKDVLPTSHMSKIIYEFQCQCDAWYVARTSLRMKDRIKQNVPLGIILCTFLKTWAFKNVHSMTTIPCASSIGYHLLNNPQCAEQCRIGWFKILSGGHSLVHLHAMEATFIRSTNPIICRQK